MMQSNEIFIPIPKPRNAQVQVLINNVDETKRVVESEWMKPATIGIGTFRLKLSNAMGQITDTYTKGMEVKFIADNSMKTRVQFIGRIDYAKDRLTPEGQYLEIEGRHKGYLSSETLIGHSATATDPATILTDIISKYLSGITTTNVNSTGLSMSVQWSYKPFWECVLELCNFAGFDAYIDNDLDFHFFQANSILNSNEAIVEFDNFISTEEWGTDDYLERTRVTAVGQDDTGLPVIYTAISSGEGSDIREVVVNDASADTVAKVQALAEAKLAELTNRPPQALVKCLSIETIEPGENLWVVIPRHKIYGIYKVLQITQKFGRGGWKTDLLMEKETSRTEQILRRRAQTESQLSQTANPNKMNYSQNYTYADDSQTLSHSGTVVDDGLLVLSSSAFIFGQWISIVATATVDVTKVEMRTVGKDLLSSRFYFSLDGGISFEQATAFNTQITPGGTGRQLVMKVELLRDASNPSPQLDSLAILYS